MNKFTEQQLEEGDRKHDEIRDAKVEKEQKLRIPTPRTDEEWAAWPYAGPGISVHFGRELERELIATRTKLNDTLTAMAMLGDKHEQEMSAARAEIEEYAEDKSRLATMAMEFREQRDRLKAWKESAIAIEKEWDPQAVGTLLNIRLGQSIRANIEPKIRELIEQRDRLDSMYHKIIKEVLECDPIPACKREDDQLEPPWEVIARIREQRDRLAMALKNLVKANETWNQGMMDVIGRPPNWNDSYLNEAKQALQSLTTNEQ
jgi:hypothetical protein